MKCKRSGYYMPQYSKAMLDRAKRKRIKLFHQRYVTGGRVVLMFRRTPARDKLSMLAWCKWGVDSHD